MLKKIRKNVLDNLPEGDAQSGLMLVLCAVVSLWLSNAANTSEGYVAMWHHEIAEGWSLLHIINDGLMAIFFFLVGLEIKKEVLEGELAHRKKALLPVLAAFGGMAVPAFIYFLFNFGTPNLKGWGIPTATDIAFSIGILALLGTRVPYSLKVFLTALAIIDDLGAVVVIALFYSQGISLLYIFGALAVTGGLYALERYGRFFHAGLWLLAGGLIWYFMHHSGIHATISGVLLAMVTPLNYKGKHPLKHLAHFFHKPVNYFIIPLFAIANTAIVINGDVISGVGTSIGLGIILGLTLGKPVGIALFTWLAVRLRWAHLPSGVGYKMIWGVGMLAGIGFTMSLFVSFLAFEDVYRQDVAKIAILIGSFLASLAGLLYLKSITQKPVSAAKKD